MAIETDFSFAHLVSSPSNLAMAATEKVPALLDLLGPLRGLVGPKPRQGDAMRKWRGKGFNMIWRPNFVGEFGPNDFFLQLNMTDEHLDFTEITGSGIANRSLFEKTVVLGGVAYTQSIKDSFDNTGQHFEPGVWAHVPATINPKEPSTVVRMGSIPHGTTINLQGVAFTATKPQFDVASIVPFKVGSKDDGATGLVHFPTEENLSATSPSRTDLSRVASLTQQQLTNPNLFLSQAIAGQTILKTTVLQLSSQAPEPSKHPPNPDVGGGTANIAFLQGKGVEPTGGSNAVAPRVTTTFWIEEIDEGGGKVGLQLQYTQRVLLNFRGLSWPHITVATLRPA